MALEQDLNALLQELGADKLSGENKYTTTHAMEAIRLLGEENGQPIGAEEASQFIQQNAPAMKTTVGEKVEAGARMFGAGLAGGLHDLGTLVNTIDLGAQKVVGTPEGVQVAQENLATSKQDRQVITDRIRADTFRPQSTVGKIGETLVEGAGEFLPDIVLAGATGMTSALGSAGKALVPKAITEMATSQSLWKKALAFTAVHGAEEGAIGVGFGGISTVLSPKVAELAVAGDGEGMMKEAGHELAMNTIMGAVIGVPLRAVGAGLKGAWKMAFKEKIAAVKPIDQPLQVDLMKNQAEYVDPVVLQETQPVRDLLRQIEEAGAAGKQEERARLEQMLAVTDPALLTKTLATRVNQLASLTDSYYKPSVMAGPEVAEAKSLAQYFREERFKQEGFGSPDAHTFFLETEREFRRMQAQVDALTKFSTDGPLLQKAYKEELEQMSRMFTEERKHLNPAMVTLVEKKLAGQALTQSEAAILRAAEVAERASMGDFVVDNRNPGMGLIRDRIYESTLARVNPFFDYGSTVRQDLEKVDLEGLVSLFNSAEGNKVNWGGVMELLHQKNPEGLGQALKSTIDRDQMASTMQDLLRRTFEGPEGTKLLREAMQGKVGAGSDGLLTVLAKDFPDHFGDKSVALLDGDSVALWKEQMKGPLDFAFSLSKEHYEKTAQMAKGWLDQQIKDGVISKADGQRMHEFLQMYDVLTGKIGRATGSYQATVPFFQKIADRVTPKGIEQIGGTWNRVAGIVSLDNFKMTGLTDWLETGLHEYGHGFWSALPKDVKTQFAEMFHALSKEDPARFTHLFQKTAAGGKHSMEAMNSLAEAGADYLGRGLVYYLKRDIEGLRQFSNSFPMHRRTAIGKALSEMIKYVDNSPLMMSPVQQLLKALDGQVKLSKILDDPVYGHWVDKIAEKSIPSEVIGVRMKAKPAFPILDVAGRIVPKGGYDEFARLTKIGADHMSVVLGEQVDVGMPMEQVADKVMKKALAAEALIKEKLPHGAVLPEILYTRTMTKLADMFERIEHAGADGKLSPVGQEYTKRVTPKGVEYLKRLKDDVDALGGFWLAEDTAGQLKAYGELEKAHGLIDKWHTNLRMMDPRLWDTLDASHMGSWAYKASKALRGSQFLSERLGPEFQKSMSVVERNWNTAQFAAKKRPVLGVIADLWTEHNHKSQEFSAKIFQNADNMLELPAGARPLEEFVMLGGRGRAGVRNALHPEVHAAELHMRGLVEKMLFLTNEHVNQTKGRGTKLLPLPLFSQDRFGNILDKGLLYKLVQSAEIHGRGPVQATREELEQAYQYYQGINATRRFIREDAMRTLEQKASALLDPESIAAMRLEMGRMDGTVPQKRDGTHAIIAKGQDGKVLFHTFFDGNAVANLTGAGDGVGSKLAKRFFGKKQQSGMTWAQETVRRFKEEGAPEWGLTADQLKDVQIVPRAELPKEVYFGASPTHLDAVIKQGIELMERDGVPKEKAAELRKYMAEALAEQTKQGGFLSSTQYRENVPGWNTQDIGVALREEVSNYAMYRSRMKALEGSLEALSLLRDDPGAFKYGNELIQNMAAGGSEYSAAVREIRNLSYWTYMAGRVSTAAIQIAGNYFMAVPRLGLEGVPRAARQLTSAMWQVAKLLKAEYGTIGDMKRLSAEEIVAHSGGKISQIEARALYEATLMGATWSSYTDTLVKNEAKGAIKLWHTALDASALPLRVMEELNRRSTFLVAFRDAHGKVGQQMKGLDPDGVFQEAMNRALKVTNDSHIDYSQVNLPAWARGPEFAKQVGRVAYTLKNFTHGYMQLLGWMMKVDKNWAQVGKMFGSLGAMGGLGAMPFVSDIAGLVGDKEGRTWKERLEKGIGEPGARLLSEGPLGALGVTDLSTRLNPIQMSMMGATTVAGMVDDMKRAKSGWDHGDMSEFLRYTPILPALARHAAEVEGGVSGKLTASGKIMSVNGKAVQYDFPDAMTKLLGFSPDNRGLTQWYRERAADRYWNEQKAQLSGEIRTAFTHTGGVPPELQQRLGELRLRTAAAGRPMGAKTVRDIIGRKRIYQDYDADD